MTGANMFAYCGNDPVNKVDVTGESPITALGIYDYYIIHRMVQERVAFTIGGVLEINVKGENGRGRLDIYDPSDNTYYEVKSISSAKSILTQRQMEKYDEAYIYGIDSYFFKQDSPATRGTVDVQGNFTYGIYDVEYWLEEDGLIAYKAEPNLERLMQYVVSIISIGACIMTISSMGSGVVSPVPRGVSSVVELHAF